MHLVIEKLATSREIRCAILLLICAVTLFSCGIVEKGFSVTKPLGDSYFWADSIKIVKKRNSFTIKQFRHPLSQSDSFLQIKKTFQYKVFDNYVWTRPINSKNKSEWTKQYSLNSNEIVSSNQFILGHRETRFGNSTLVSSDTVISIDGRKYNCYEFKEVYMYSGDNMTIVDTIESYFGRPFFPIAFYYKVSIVGQKTSQNVKIEIDP